MKVTALATTVVISSLPFINGYQTQRRTIQRLSNQESIEQEEDVFRYLSTTSMSMEAIETYDPFLELAPNVTESAIEEAAGIVAGHSDMFSKSSKVSMYYILYNHLSITHIILCPLFLTSIQRLFPLLPRAGEFNT